MSVCRQRLRFLGFAMTPFFQDIDQRTPRQPGKRRAG
jgi:hypothetical protein